MESINSNTALKTLEYVQQKKGGSKVYAQGLFALAVFVVSIFVAFFVYIPFITGTQEIARQREEVELDIKALEAKYAAVNGYDRDTLATNLEVAKKYVPDSIRVAQLATFINLTAKQHSLEISQLGINENQSEIKPAGSEEKATLLGSNKNEKKVYFGKVEGPFSFKGTRENIYKFLDFLVLGGYATNFDQVTITGTDKDDEWTVSLAASYYYLQPLVAVEPGRALMDIQEEALIPLRVVALPTIIPGEVTITPSITPTPSN